MRMDMFKIETETKSGSGIAQIARYTCVTPLERTQWESDSYRLDLSLTPRPANARARFSSRWGEHRFERLGALYALPPGERVHFKSDPGSTLSVVCDLPPACVAKWLEGPDRWSGRLLHGALNLHNFRIHQILQGIAHELGHPGFAHEAMIELATAQVALELARCAEIAFDESAPGGLAPWRLRLIDDRLRDEGSPPSIGDLAGLCSLSPRQLARAFRQSRGCSLGQYVAQARVESAKRHLATDCSIKAIAGMLGFGTAASFTYAFRRSTGLSPREFRSRSAG